VAGSYEYFNEPLDSIKGRVFLDELSEHCRKMILSQCQNMLCILL
jgi:hypothetical protein